MGKIHGLGNHSVTGKIGAFVYAKGLGGETVVRNYTAQVKNPNTLRQQNSRNRLAFASQFAAALATVIGVGYAKAAAGAKMYARNIFVKDFMPLFTIAGGTPEVSYDEVKVSKGYGVVNGGIFGSATSSQSGKVVVPVSALPEVVEADGGEWGVVAVVYNPDLNQSVMAQAVGSATTTNGITINVPADWTGMQGYVYAFFKWIPGTGNEIATTTQPWKYPSTTGDTVYAGTVNIA